MSGVIKIEILETVDELRQLLQSIESKEVKERVQTLYWLKSGQVQTTKALANADWKTQSHSIKMVK